MVVPDSGFGETGVLSGQHPDSTLHLNAACPLPGFRFHGKRATRQARPGLAPCQRSTFQPSRKVRDRSRLAQRQSLGFSAAFYHTTAYIQSENSLLQKALGALAAGLRGRPRGCSVCCRFRFCNFGVLGSGIRDNVRTGKRTWIRIDKFLFKLRCLLPYELSLAEMFRAMEILRRRGKRVRDRAERGKKPSRSRR